MDRDTVRNPKTHCNVMMVLTVLVMQIHLGPLTALKVVIFVPGAISVFPDARSNVKPVLINLLKAKGRSKL